MQIKERLERLELAQELWPDFISFLDAVMELLGFSTTWLQHDIAEFLADGPDKKMVQAQRGEAKTTITGAYAVYRLLHNPSMRVLIVSGGGTLATQISSMCIQILEGMPELACLLPDKSKATQRTSVEAYDLHYHFKGIDKSPSLASMGITANMQGVRADLLIADDVETQKNSETPTQREKLNHLTKDFSSICVTGEITFLGTPQTVDSVYNTLPGRGYTVRIWPGRYPMNSELNNYGDFLAPIIREHIERYPALQTGGGIKGDRGQPTDPELKSEAFLIDTELDQGQAYFQLQHMLDTEMTDALKYPLKAENLPVMLLDGRKAPVTIDIVKSTDNLVLTPKDMSTKASFYRVNSTSKEQTPYIGTHMYIDPTGGGANGDELAIAVSSMAASKIWIREVIGRPGGYTDEVYNWIIKQVVRWKPETISIEKNYGNGALEAAIRPLIARKHACTIEGVYEAGQKELRVIDTLEPIMGRGSLILDERLIQEDWERCKTYPAKDRIVYSLVHQLVRITRDRGALIHDDKLEALAGTARHWIQQLEVDEEKEKVKAQKKAYEETLRDPLGNGRPHPLHGAMKQGLSILTKFARR